MDQVGVGSRNDLSVVLLTRLSILGWRNILALISIVEFFTLKLSVTIAFGLKTQDESVTYLVNSSEVLSSILVDVFGLIAQDFSGEIV